MDFFAPGPALNPATDGDQPVSDVVLLRAQPSRLNSPDLGRSSYLRGNAVEPTSGPGGPSNAGDFSVERSVQITIDERGSVTTRAGLLVRPRADQADPRDPGDPDER